MTSDELLSLLPLVLASLVPFCLVGAAFLISRQRSRFLTVAVFVTTLTATLAYLAVLLRLVLWLLGYDARTTQPDSVWNTVVQLDIVSGAMFVLVSTLVLVVVRYSRTYLAGQRELNRYARYLLLTVASVSVLVTSNHLAVLMVAWFATDVGLHQLLTFYRRRRQAIIVAHKKFLLSRVADACFVASIVLIGGATGSLRIDVVNAVAQHSGDLSPTLHLATVLLVIGVILKSAQLPFHGWLLQVMEAPTPVSALLHAGVVNIGGFVMIRLAPLMAHASLAQNILIGVGLLSTVVASLVMATRAAIKSVLAWSTIGQMGFMLVQCGLGAWHLALMHLLAHSLYKAHTFLSASSVVQQWRGGHLVHHPHTRIWHLLAGVVLACMLVAPFYGATYLPHRHWSTSVALLALVLGFSFAPMIGRGLAAGWRAFGLVMLFTVGASASYFGWHMLFDEAAPSISAILPASELQWQIVIGGLVVLFLAQSIMQTRPEGRFSNWIQPHLDSGLYIDDWFTRVTFRLLAARAPMTDPALREAVERACARIAPTWPLDRFIAVNPFWPLTHKPLPEVAGDLAALSGGRLLMPREWYAEEWRAGRLRAEHLREAIDESGADVTEEDLIASFWIGEPAPSRRPLVVDVMEKLRHREHELTWRDFVMERISRFCAAYFDDGQGQISGVRAGGVYASWWTEARGDQLPRLFMALGNYRATAKALPKTADEMIARGMTDLGVPMNQCERYLSALLLDINGWASWCAYLRWTARQAGGDDDHLRELLAIRLAWEWILFSSSDEAIRAEWRFAMTSWSAIDRAAQLARSDDWILQRAVEIALLSPVCPKLVDGFAAPRPSMPKLQAAFCLDVRSEVYRRALEAQGAGIQTLGVAGFFGLPIEYLPLAADDARPQLPGLLAPRYRVTDTSVPAGLEAKRHARLDASYAWKAFKSSSLSSFAFVDAMGLYFARNLYQDALGRDPHRSRLSERAGLTDAEDRTRKPRLTSHADGTSLAPEERCDLAESFLRTIGLTRDFARIVLLVGHGSETKNNAHAAGIDCGACCGQPGDVNARAAAALLNDEKVRAGLALRGIVVPASTLFVGALHNTTTDEVTLFDEGADVTTHAGDLAALVEVLDRASAATRRARAPALGLGDLSDAKLHAAVVKRARNWAEVRPEWGLAGNAVLIVAPRERSRHLDLEGRAFLHDYRFEDDPDHAILEAIMTGPLVVAHWINFQYYASTVDNARYGCGNKVLHNIVGGHLGVFEGNGGDLRIGLSLQSLHDGERWVHTPLRLSVFIEATRPAIGRVLEKHPKVRELVDNQWLHLFQLDVAERAVFKRSHDGWRLAPTT